MKRQKRYNKHKQNKNYNKKRQNHSNSYKEKTKDKSRKLEDVSNVSIGNIDDRINKLESRLVRYDESIDQYKEQLRLYREAKEHIEFRLNPEIEQRDAISHELHSLYRIKEGPDVSDHAVLRYLQRKHQLNIDMIRKSIGLLVPNHRKNTILDGNITSKDSNIILACRKGVISTVLFKDWTKYEPNKISIVDMDADALENILKNNIDKITTKECVFTLIYYAREIASRLGKSVFRDFLRLKTNKDLADKRENQ